MTYKTTPSKYQTYLCNLLRQNKLWCVISAASFSRARVSLIASVAENVSDRSGGGDSSLFLVHSSIQWLDYNWKVMMKTLICFFEGDVARSTTAVQLWPIKTTATVGKPLQSLHCAGPSTCQDLLCFQCPHYVFHCHIPTAPHKNSAYCGQSCSRKTKSHCQLHMRTLWDPHVILMKGSAQTCYRFFSACFEEYQNLLFLFRDLSGIEMKTCPHGIAVKIRDMCTLFSETWMHPCGEDVSQSFQGLRKLQEMIKQFCKLRLKTAVQLSKLWRLNKRKEPQFFFYAHTPLMHDSKVFSSCSILHVSPKGIEQWRIL